MADIRQGCKKYRHTDRLTFRLSAKKCGKNVAESTETDFRHKIALTGGKDWLLDSSSPQRSCRQSIQTQLPRAPSRKESHILFSWLIGPTIWTDQSLWSEGIKYNFKTNSLFSKFCKASGGRGTTVSQTFITDAVWSASRIFSGFRSRWTMPFSCKCLTATTICRNTGRTTAHRSSPLNDGRYFVILHVK